MKRVMIYSMNLNYIDYVKSNRKNEIKKIFVNSFPKSERFPFFILRRCSKGTNVIFNVILDKDKLIGMEYIIECSDFTYLMYLAVDKKQRNNGYGSQVLSNLIKKYKNVILSIERPDKNCYNEKNKRKNFYLRNGFYETNKFIGDNGVEYELLCTNKNYIVTPQKLKERYTKMASSIMMKWLIGKLFNVDDINFIN